MINKLKFVSVTSISVTILFIVNIMCMELQSEGYVYAQNSHANEVSMNDTSRFFIPITISIEAQEKLENITSNMPPFTTPGSNDFEGWKKLNQQIESMVIAESKPILVSLEPNITFTQLGNVDVLDIRPKDWIDNGKILVYTHGGGIQF